MTVVASLAPYASDPAGSLGRLHGEAEAPYRTAFQRDRDRIIHSTAFRRLKHKTQVFIYDEGDHYRTRLTHSLEVAQIARTVARSLALSEDLAEAVALAHDLGHTPFGHAGEGALDHAMAAHGGFDHNVQTLRILTRLERRYAEFDGLNLTWETLEGVVKHNGPLTGPHGPRMPVPAAIADYDRLQPLLLDSFAGGEAQVAALCDDIAYHTHDLDDGLRAGLFGIADLLDVPLVGGVFAELKARYGEIEPGRLIHEATRRLIHHMVTDMLTETRRRLDEAAPDSAMALRGLGRPVVAFSEAMAANERTLRAFLMERMYRHHRLNRMTSKVKRVVSALFEQLSAEPNTLPEAWRASVPEGDPARTARLVGDYIAGMTDRYALDEHSRLFDPHRRT